MKLYKYEKQAIDKLVGKQTELGSLWSFDRKDNICKTARRSYSIEFERRAKDYFEIETLLYETNELLKKVRSNK